MSVEDLCLLIGLAVASPALVWAAASDLRHYLIPNRSCVLVAGGYLLALPVLGITSWAVGLGLGVGVLALGVVLFARGWVGGGDVKFAAAITPWAGLSGLEETLMVASFSGAVLATVMLTPARRLLPSGPSSDATGLRQPMPFGVPLALAGAWALLRQFQPFIQGLLS